MLNLRLRQIMGLLQVEPERRRGPEIARQPQSGVGGDRPAFAQSERQSL